jgi:hypothetical protein
MKEIYFLIDGLITCNLLNCLEGCKICTTFDTTEDAIKNGISKIATYSMIHFSFDLLDMGYDIYLVNDGNFVKITPHMSEIDKDLKKGHNIRKLFLAGVFDDLVNYKR